MNEPDRADELRAAREVIAALQRRLERAAQLDLRANPARKAIATLENTVDSRTRALAESEARYRALFDHSPSLAFTVDDEGRITRANAAAEQLLGRDRELVGSRLVDSFRPPGDRVVADLLARGGGEANELTIVGGRIVDLDVAPLPEFAKVQVLARDVTTRVELGRELQHARRLAAIGHLAAGVAHEINNPLAVLQFGLVELRDQASGAMREQLDELLTHGERISRIVANLHTFAEPRPPDRQRVELDDLVRGARRIAGRAMIGVRVFTSFEPEDLAVLVDRRQLEQVVVNLLTNAARVMVGGGRLEIGAERVGERVIVHVLDSGPGIPGELLDHVFTPFVTAGTQGGMGLGLSISWGLVQENGGSIRAYNPPEGGACFEIDLPAAADVVEVRPSLRSAPNRTVRSTVGNLEILCVDDESALRRSLIRLLGTLGHRSHGVESAERALEALAENSYDLVISDVRLPGIDGERLRELIGERHPALRDRVLLISGVFRESSEPDDFLQKPFTVQQLREAIAMIMERS
jgi:PAS domain S-box-containing protein